MRLPQQMVPAGQCAGVWHSMRVAPPPGTVSVTQLSVCVVPCTQAPVSVEKFQQQAPIKLVLQKVPLQSSMLLAPPEPEDELAVVPAAHTPSSQTLEQHSLASVQDVPSSAQLLHVPL